MVHVGSSFGLPITLEEMKVKPFRNSKPVLDQLLVIELKYTGWGMGEYILGRQRNKNKKDL
jgi:hypothetical protein